MTFKPVTPPEWAEWKQRGGIILDRTGWPYDENHKQACRWCKAKLPSRRTSWCSEECSDLFGNFWSWGAIRIYVIRRAGERCERCGTPRTPGCHPWEVDHILPVREGGTDDPANLRCLCHECHVIVGYRQRGKELVEQLDIFEGI